MFGLLIRGWSSTEYTVSRERLRIATVTEGPFLRDVSAQGTVVAAVSPTLFASRRATSATQVRAGDTVQVGQVLATLDSPSLENEYQRERATLESLDTALQRQAIEIRRQMLATKEAADLANVRSARPSASSQRAQAAWDKGAIRERDLKAAEDDRESAKLAYDHADGDHRARAGKPGPRPARAAPGARAPGLRGREPRSAASTSSSVRSPVDGMVANLAAAEKASVAENAPLMTVVDLSAFEVEFQVADVYARDIKAGMEAEISLDGREFKGLVTAISPEVRSGQVTGRVKFAGEQPPGLRQSQRGSVRIVIEQRAKAVKFERSSDIAAGTRAVYVVEGDQAILTPVELGAACVGEIEVLKGLAPARRS